nr:hypothetical protein Iba_chr04dCG12150 [Ipomoea batatas]
MYDHNAESCLQNQKHDEEVEQNMDQEEGDWTTAKSGTGNGSLGSEKGKVSLSKEKTQIRPEVMEDYDPWMVVVRTGRKVAKNQDKRNQNGSGYGKNDMRKDTAGDEVLGELEVEVDLSNESEKIRVGTANEHTLVKGNRKRAKMTQVVGLDTETVLKNLVDAEKACLENYGDPSDQLGT